ncbi:MAG: hypothetical protein WB609_10310 [Candidatus Cybelea sp.]
MFLLWRLGLWDADVLKIAIFWFFGAAVAALFSTDQVHYGSFGTLIFKTIAFTALLEFIVNLYTFPLPIEFVLVPIVLFVAASRALLDVKPEFKSDHYNVTRDFLTFVSGAIGILILGLAIFATIRNWKAFATAQSLEDFLLPAILTLLFIPYLYGVRVSAMLQLTFVRATLALTGRPELLRFCKRQIISACNVNLKRAQQFESQYSGRLWDLQTHDDAVKLFADFRIDPTGQSSGTTTADQ